MRSTNKLSSNTKIICISSVIFMGNKSGLQDNSVTWVIQCFAFKHRELNGYILSVWLCVLSVWSCLLCFQALTFQNEDLFPQQIPSIYKLFHRAFFELQLLYHTKYKAIFAFFYKAKTYHAVTQAFIWIFNLEKSNKDTEKYFVLICRGSFSIYFI